jgi:hypothetical protein
MTEAFNYKQFINMLVETQSFAVITDVRMVSYGSNFRIQYLLYCGSQDQYLWIEEDQADGMILKLIQTYKTQMERKDLIYYMETTNQSAILRRIELNKQAEKLAQDVYEDGLHYEREQEPWSRKF